MRGVSFACRCAISIGVLTFWAGVAYAQATGAGDSALQALRSRPRLAWSQADRELAFARWGELYPARVIRRGERARELPTGPSLPTFAADEGGDKQLRLSLESYRLAGIVVLHEGRVRLE